MNYDAPFLTAEQRGRRLFEVNTLRQLEDELIFVLTKDQTNTGLEAAALMVIRQWADNEYAAIERKYRVMAIENTTKRRVTTWVK